MSDKIVWHYDASKNPGGEFYPGVPLTDLTEDDVAGLSEHNRAGVEAAPWYRKTAPKDEAAEAKTPAQAKGEGD